MYLPHTGPDDRKSVPGTAYPRPICAEPLTRITPKPTAPPPAPIAMFDGMLVLRPISDIVPPNLFTPAAVYFTMIGLVPPAMFTQPALPQQ